jgi:hypothetical protein
MHLSHPHVRGGAGGHLGFRRALLFFVGAFFGLAAIGGAISAIKGAPHPKAPCRPSQPVCIQPPSPSGLAPRLVTETEYRDPQGRFRFEYPSDLLSVRPTSDGVAVTLIPGYDQGDFALAFQASSASRSPDALARDRLSALSDRIIGLTVASDPRQTLLGPAVGFRSGVGGAYEGELRETRAPIHVFVMSSSDGRSTVAMSVAISSNSQKRIEALLAQTDHLLNSFRFASDLQAAGGGPS